MVGHIHNHFPKICLLILATIIIVAGGLAWCLSAPSRALADNAYPLMGWLWSGNFGWISLNSGNPKPADIASGSAYDVSVSGGQVSGWGWSTNLGWVCFGAACTDACGTITDNCIEANTDPDSAVPSASIDSQGHILGWARAVAWGDRGWINLGRANASAPGDVGRLCFGCKPKCTATDSLTGNCLGLAKDQDGGVVYDSCNFCFTKTVFDSGAAGETGFGRVPIDAVDAIAGGSGKICESCANCGTINSADGQSHRIGDKSNVADIRFYNHASSTLDCLCSVCRNYGVIYGSTTIPVAGVSDFESSKNMAGWAWNANNNATGEISNLGIGWVDFYDVGVVYPWLQTEYSAIYSGQSINAAAAAGFNATYCIFAQNVSWQFGSRNCQSRNISDVTLKNPVATNDVYSNALGRLDLAGLVATSSVVSGSVYNKYGNIVVKSGATTWDGSGPSQLSDKVYFVNGDLTINSGFTINNGTASAAGDGTVIVNGNLFINSDFNYSGGAAPNNKAVGSVAWIVKGDIVNNPNVTQTVGAFIALGKPDPSIICRNVGGVPCDESLLYPRYEQNGYGIYFSGESAKPLKVNGLIMAKGFDFRRQFADVAAGSEQIIYDNRLTINPPPGTKSLLEGLPVIRDFEYGY